ncbi:Adenylate kinase 4 [Spironucleus salmonicida]|uniref:Adenylate kinase 4 n=1 Tax=Spironucleus salmonicida TaxID=348837 RepID=K7R1J3_9EUKA|nr:adenylate kinase 4 [Spironucleus salmonicida]KAH0576530.1 Adenylate kinase 4 [Spironucleus salmonicida]|eukprot:EST45744.1 Adenylate kinase 4 (CMP-UMP kinase) [Spironucleus salmonicida]
MRPIFFILGKPGSGKGTVCEKISDHFQLKHLSAGDLLRAEQKRDQSPHKDLILNYIASGKIVPADITVTLLKNAMNEDSISKGFLIDGFPREMPQFKCFAEQLPVTNVQLIELLCNDDKCYERIKGRGQGRIDDNDATCKIRIDNYNSETTKVVQLFEQESKLIRIDGNGNKDLVLKQTVELLTPFLK